MSASIPAPRPDAARRIRSPLRLRTGLAGGLTAASILALAGWQLARLPWLSPAGPMACTLLLAILYRQLLGYPEAMRAGVSFAGTKLLRAAIVLFGLKLPIDVVLQQGLPYVARAACTLAFALAASLLLARLLKADGELTLLLAIGTGICGAAAIAATAPLLGAEERKTALGAGLIAAIGTMFAIAYTLLEPLLPLSGDAYGVWAGLSLHEIAHVAMAAAAGGPDALADGMLAKLSRVLLLVPLAFGLQALMLRRRRRSAGSANGGRAGDGRAGLRGLPWYLLGFLVMSLLTSAQRIAGFPLPDSWLDGASQLTTPLLTVAMAGLGLNVSLRELRFALRPLAVLLLVSALLSALTLLSLL